MTVAEICPRTGQACVNAARIDSSLPFEGCPGEVQVSAFTSIEKGKDEHGQEDGTIDIQGPKSEVYLVCGVNALERAIFQKALEALSSKATIGLADIRQAAAQLVLATEPMPGDVIGVHSLALGYRELGANVQIFDESKFKEITG